MGTDGAPPDSSRRKHRRSSERYEDEEGEAEMDGSKARKHHRHHHHRRHRDRGHCSKDERGDDGEAEPEEDGGACPAALITSAADVSVRADLDDEMEEGEILDDEEGGAPVDSERGKIEPEGVDSNSNHLASSKEENLLLEKEENSHNLNAIQEETKEEIHDKDPGKPLEIHSGNGKLLNSINHVEAKEHSRGSCSRKLVPEYGECRAEVHLETNISSSQLFLDETKDDCLNMEVRDSEKRESESRHAENKYNSAFPISKNKDSSYKRKHREEVDCKTSEYDLERHRSKRRSASSDVHRNILDNNERSISPYSFEDKYKTRELSPSYKHQDDTRYGNRLRSDIRSNERSCEDRAISSSTWDKYRNDSDYERGATSVRLDRDNSKSRSKESDKEKVARRERERSRSHGRHAKEDRHGSRDRDMEKDSGRRRDQDRDQIADTIGERERGRSRDRDREKTVNTTREKERGRSRNKHRERTVDTVRERDRDRSRDRDRAKAIGTHRERDKGRERESARLGDTVRKRERERDGNSRVRDRESRKEHDRKSCKERDEELEHRERDRSGARDNHNDLRDSEYGKSYHHSDKTKSKEYAKQSRLKNHDYKEEKEKPSWDEDEEDYQGKIEQQLSKQEEEDPEKIIEESRRRRLAILEKYKQQHQQNSPQVSEPLSDNQGKETCARTPEESPIPAGVVRDQVANAVIDGTNDNSDVFVTGTSFSIGKSPQPNGTSTFEKTSSCGLGHGTPKSERSADMFCDDIFGESPTSVRKVGKEENVVVERSGLHDNWDDAEGYYSYRFGEVLDTRYEILAAHGKGVFSTVVRAKDLKAGKGDPEEVAIKIIRNNETMYKAGLEELVILKKLAGADREDRRHCVRFLSSFNFSLR